MLGEHVPKGNRVGRVGSGMKGLTNNEQAVNFWGLMPKLAGTRSSPGGFLYFLDLHWSVLQVLLQLHVNPQNYDRGPNDLKFCRLNEHFRGAQCQIWETRNQSTVTLAVWCIPSSAADKSKRSRNCMRLWKDTLCVCVSVLPLLFLLLFLFPFQSITTANTCSTVSFPKASRRMLVISFPHLFPSAFHKLRFCVSQDQTVSRWLYKESLVFTDFLAAF